LSRRRSGIRSARTTVSGVNHLWLAREIERLEAASARAAALAAGGCYEDVFGGTAAFAGAGSPLTHAVGLGIGLNLTAPQLDQEYGRLESFFARNLVSPNLEVSTLAEFHLLDLLVTRGFKPFEWNHILWRRLRPGDWLPPSRVDVRQSTDGEQWSCVVAQGFFERTEISEAEMNIGRPLFRSGGARAYTAYVDGQPAGCGALFLHEGLALFHCDSTLPAFRGHGVQAALIRRRLIDAVASGAWLATCATAPGSISQRNYERQGFSVLYARLGLLRE
jgi:GNAT superfamily N-acetyltransferase